MTVTSSCPFATRHITAAPLHAMSAPHLDRAPLQAPEWRGITPRAALHRQRAQQLALLAHYEASIARPPAPVEMPQYDGPAPRTWGWTLATICLLLAIVAGCARVAGLL